MRAWCRVPQVLAEAMIGATTRSTVALRALPDLEAIAKDLVGRGKAAWPRIGVEPKAFLAHLGACIEKSVSPSDPSAREYTVTPDDVREALAEIHAQDLWLAFACGHGNKIAIGELDRQLEPVVDTALARMKDKVSVEDVAQLLREKLLVAKDGSAPKILDYSGRGPLGGWMRIAAIRTALSLTRHGDAAGMQAVTREALLGVPATATDPELDHLRKRYAKEFKEAFEAALAELTAEERNLLRLSLVDQLSIDEIGTVFGIHRATAARRVARAREIVQERTRKILGQRLDVGTAELRSIMGYIRSHLDLSIHRLLTADIPDLPKSGKRGPPPSKKKARASAPKGIAARSSSPKGISARSSRSKGLGARSSSPKGISTKSSISKKRR
jgi:RNA polymerase sigma-70 factor, ECF subfamily